MLLGCIRVFWTVLASWLVVVGGTAHAANQPDLAWYTIDTEHFAVHYPVSKRDKEAGNKHYLTAEWSARKMADVAEEIWAPMCAEFNYYLKSKIHVVVLNQEDRLEGFTVPTYDWIQISANPGGTFYRGRGRMEWFSDVFVHEFAHVVSLKANGAMGEGGGFVLLGGLYQDGINRGVPANRPVTDVNAIAVGGQVILGDSDSVFWTEGGAEYWSDNTGYNWWTTSRDQNIRMTVLQDRLLEYDEWHNRSYKYGWGDSERYYQQGYSFGLYLRQRFGDKTYARFATEHGRRWRWEWVSVIEDVLGIDAETLYWDWRNYVTERYQAQYDKVKQKGEVSGLLLQGWQEWDFEDPSDRDKWFQKNPWKRDKKQEATGRYVFEPRVSPDGRFMGVNNGGAVSVQPLHEDSIPGFTGLPPMDGKNLEDIRFGSAWFPANYEHGWDFVPGKNALVLTGREHSVEPFAAELFHARPTIGGYNWNQLYYFDMPERETKWGNRKVKTRARRSFLKPLFKKHEMWAKGSYKRIPNTQRGSDPSISPDGKRIAYFEYTDGVLNLVTIAMDGSDKKHLTTFDDGTWLQTVDWSPDGDKLVFAIFKNYQQNLYIVDADGSNLTAIMQDAWEEMDAHWSADGRIYFAADPDGIFNIYSYDVESQRFTQITNVINSAVTPQITPQGNLIYTGYTAYGWKTFALARDVFLNASADHHFVTEFEADDVADGMAFRDDLSGYAAKTTRYSPIKSMMGPVGVPIFRLEGTDRAEVGLEGGGQLQMNDFVQNHNAFMVAMLGEDSYLLGAYTYDGWYPSLTLFGQYRRMKFTNAYLLDEDEDPETKSDQTIWEIKRGQQVMYGAAALSVPINDAWQVGVQTSYLHYDLRSAFDPKWDPYMNSTGMTGYVTFSNISPYYQYGAQIVQGRGMEMWGTHGWTDMVNPSVGGVTIDDGEILDAYQYNRIEWSWTENVKLPSFWGVPFLKKARDAGHVLQFGSQIGVLDRNVDMNNEFRAGGQHPYYTNATAIQPNTQFAGYPGWSLSGETMAIFNMSYQFPLNRYGQWRWGPFTTSGIFMQMGGTAGNLWSFRPPSSPNKSYRTRYDNRIAFDKSDIRREVPFVDVAYKNGNRMLYDAFAEVRIASVFRDGFYWNSFMRLAYGFNAIRGYGDVDGNGISDTSDNDVGDELSSESEPSGWRIYLGLGTGW